MLEIQTIENMEKVGHQKEQNEIVVVARPEQSSISIVLKMENYDGGILICL